MTKRIKQKINSVFSITNMILMILQSFVPGILAFMPTHAFANEIRSEVGKVDLEFSQKSNEFDLNIAADRNVDYLVSYQGSEMGEKGGVMGVAVENNGVASASEYAGTCSTDGCVADEVIFGDLELPHENFKSSFIIDDTTLWLVASNSATVPTVDLGTIYRAPQNNDVQVVFTKLPRNPGSLVIKEITLTNDQAKKLGAYNQVAYDITSDMVDGTFEYELKLPLPAGADNKAGMVYAESLEELDAAVAVKNEVIEDGKVIAKGLNHFTVFVVTFEDPQNPAPTDAGYNDIWFDYSGGTVTQVPSGTNGITSSDGVKHAEVTGPVFTRWGGYNSEFPVLGYDTSLDVYLDMTLADGSDKRFDFSSAINNPAGDHRRDFIIHLGTNPSVPGQWLASASNNAPGWPGNPAGNPADITDSGWYTIEHSFRENASGVLEVTISLYKKGESTPVGSWLRSDASDIIGTTVGGNRYGWFTSQRFDFDWLAVDNSTIMADDPTVTTVIIPKDNTNWMFNRDTSTSSPYEFNTDESVIGAGALYALPISNTYPVAGKAGYDKFIAENFIMSPLVDIDEISYDFKIGSGGSASDENHFYMNVYANFGETDINNYYDCRYNVVPTIGSTTDFTTVTFDLNQAYPVTTRGSSPYPCPAVPADMDSLSAGSTIRVFALNMGDTSSNDTGLDGYFDNVVVDMGSEVTVYDLEPDLEAPEAPTNIRILDHAGTDLSCEGFTNNRTITIDWSDNTEPDFDHYDYRIREGNIIRNPIVSELTGDIRDEDGYYKYSVRAVDTNGNESEWSEWCGVTLDREAPEAPENTGFNSSVTDYSQEPTELACGEATNLNQISHHWSTVDGAVSYQRQWVYPGQDPTVEDNWNGAENWTTNYTNYRSFGGGGGTEGLWNVRVRAQDAAGNWSEYSDACEVTYDTTAPAKPTGLRRLLASDHNVVYECSASSVIQSFHPDWDDNSESDFSHYEYSSFNANGGQGINERRFDESIFEYNGSWLPGDGTYGFAVRAVDFAGNKSDWAQTDETLAGSCQITYDSTAPSTPEVLGFLSPDLDCGAITNIHNTTVDWTDAVDSGIGFDHYVYNIDYPNPNGTRGDWTTTMTPSQYSGSLNEGAHHVRVKGVDTLGNESDWSNTCTITTDWTAPDVEVTTPAAGLVKGIVEVKGTVTDENPHHYWFVIQNSSGTNVAGPGVVNDTSSFTDKLLLDWDTTSLPSGEYTIKLEARDAANNKDGGSSDWVKVTVDNTKPTLTVTTPSNDDAIAGAFTVEGTATDDGSDIKDIRVRFRNESGNALIKTFWAVYDDSTDTWILDVNDGFNDIVDGYYRIVVRARDNNGNTKFVTKRRVHLDNTTPSSVITTFDLEDDGEVETPTFDGLIEGTSTDEPTDIASGVAEVLLEIMHTPFGATTSSYWSGSDWETGFAQVTATGTDSWSYQIAPEEKVLEGTYVVTSHAIDNAGNVETTYTITIVYDKTIPEVILTIDPTSPDGANGWYVSEPTVTLTASDNYILDYIEYQWNSTVGTWTTYTAPITPPGEGQNVLYYRSVDVVGNVSDLGVKEVKFDTVAPEDAPINVRVESIKSTTATGRWDRPENSDDINEYKLSWKHKEDGTEHSATVSSETFEHELDNLYDGLWEFRVFATDSAGHTKSASTDFRVGSEPSSGDVLGATDTTSGIGGLVAGVSNFVTGDSDKEEETKDSTSETKIEDAGTVLGDSDSSCATWQYYLPLFILLIQLMFAASLEIANKEPGKKKILMALAASVLAIAAFYIFKNEACYGDTTGIIQTMSKWFAPLSLTLAVVFRWLGSMTVEEK